MLASSFALCFINYHSWGDCSKNSIEWIRNWRLICSLEDVIKSDENLESHIEKERDNIWVYMLMGRTLGWALVYVDWALLSQIFFFFFELVNLCIAIIIWIVYLFTNVYKFIVPHSLKLTFGKKKTKKKNSLREKIIFCIHLSQRERKRHRVVYRAQT